MAKRKHNVTLQLSTFGQNMCGPKTKVQVKLLAHHSPSVTYPWKPNSITRRFDEAPTAATLPKRNKVEVIYQLCDDAKPFVNGALISLEIKLCSMKICATLLHRKCEASRENYFNRLLIQSLHSSVAITLFRKKKMSFAALQTCVAEISK